MRRAPLPLKPRLGAPVRSQGLDDQRLVIACPDMKRARRRLFLERLHALRAEGFLSPAARELAAAIRQARPCPRESPVRWIRSGAADVRPFLRV